MQFGKPQTSPDCDAFKLHGKFSPDITRELASEFHVIRAFATHTHFRPEDVALFPNCDALIDAHHPDLRGGTGQTCNWQDARAALAFARFSSSRAV